MPKVPISRLSNCSWKDENSRLALVNWELCTGHSQIGPKPPWECPASSNTLYRLGQWRHS